MEMGQLIHYTGQLIAAQMDEYTRSVRGDDYESGTLSKVVASQLPKGRLLYYYSPNEMKRGGHSAAERVDSWCGWHNDHSALTGLALGMFFNDESGEIIDDLEDESAGLYVKTRQGVDYHLQLNERESSQYLAFQIGETSQILSGGSLYATPHAVRGPSAEYAHVSRASFAVFMQPDHTHHMSAPTGKSLDEIQFDRHLPPAVPTLASRWSNQTGDTFGDFTARTLSVYY